jgi:hypothetical protein
MTAKSWLEAFPTKKASTYCWDIGPTTVPWFFAPALTVGLAQHGAGLSLEFDLPDVRSSPHRPLHNIGVIQEAAMT